MVTLELFVFFIVWGINYYNRIVFSDSLIKALYVGDEYFAWEILSRL